MMAFVEETKVVEKYTKREDIFHELVRSVCVCAEARGIFSQTVHRLT
jgi:hypothetical protein